jgi:phosphomannomutase/phosphoglucomutase
VNPAIFREYDIRGAADRDLPDAVVTAIGAAFAAAVAERGGRRVAVGRDCRLTSERIRDALVDGITGAGLDVLDLGVVPSPLVYFAADRLEVDGAVVVTGSHNPPADNGLKLLIGGAALHGEAIADLRRRAGSPFAAAASRGVIARHDVAEDYLAFAAASLRLGTRRPRVVLDGGNGAGGPIGARLYRRIGCEVIELYCDMDGRFPNHHPDPTVEANLEALRRAVADSGAELGVALDGDGDRIGVVDGRGRVIWGDQLMLLLGRDLLAEVPGATFIGEVKCSQAMYDGLAAAGGRPIMWKVGHSLIKAKMKETGAVLAGEMSGHLFFAHRYLGFDDGAYAGARVIELLSRSPASLAERFDELPETESTPERRRPCPDAEKAAIVARVATTLRERPDVREVIEIDGVRAVFDGGWGLVRASNTQAALAIRCEAATAERLAEIEAAIEAALAAAGGES